MSAYTDALAETRDGERPVLVRVVCSGDHGRGGDVLAGVVRRTVHGPRFEARHPIPGQAGEDAERLTRQVRGEYRAVGRDLPRGWRVRVPHQQVAAGVSEVLLDWPRERRTVTVVTPTGRVDVAGGWLAPGRLDAVAHCPRHGPVAVDEDELREAYARALTSRVQRVLVRRHV